MTKIHAESEFKTPQVRFQIRQNGFKFFNAKEGQGLVGSTA
jgi:hypothetical protein